MSRSSGRAQTEPLAALVAVLTVVAALGAYATVYGTVLPDSRAPKPTPTLEHATDALSRGGVIDLDRLDTFDSPRATHLRVTVRAADRTWARGPLPPSRDEPTAARPVPVRVAGRVVPGRLRVVVWS